MHTRATCADFAAPTQIILKSHKHHFGRDLVPPGSFHEEATALYDAPFVMLSALGPFGSDHVFNYANRAALQIFQARGWNDLVGLPSSQSAEPDHREERRRLLDEVGRRGFIENYSGVRISRQGRRFLIKNATVFNLLDDAGAYLGQAAMFTDWEPLPPSEATS